MDPHVGFCISVPPPQKKNLPLAPVHFGLQGFRASELPLLTFPRVFPASCMQRRARMAGMLKLYLVGFSISGPCESKVWLVRLLCKIFQRSDVVVPCFMRLQGLAAPVVLLQSDFR